MIFSIIKNNYISIFAYLDINNIKKNSFSIFKLQDFFIITLKIITVFFLLGFFFNKKVWLNSKYTKIKYN